MATKSECRCEKKVCGCEKAGACICGPGCTCQTKCECGSGCSCAVNK